MEIAKYGDNKMECVIIFITNYKNFFLISHRLRKLIVQNCRNSNTFSLTLQGCTGHPFFASGRGGAEEKIFGAGRGGAGEKCSGRGGVTV